MSFYRLLKIRLHGCFIVVDDGPMDMNSIEHDHLDEVIAKGEMLSDVTVEARKYLSTVIIIRQFRDALKKQNWSAVQKTAVSVFLYRDNTKRGYKRGRRGKADVKECVNN